MRYVTEVRIKHIFIIGMKIVSLWHIMIRLLGWAHRENCAQDRSHCAQGSSVKMRPKLIRRSAANKYTCHGSTCFHSIPPTSFMYAHYGYVVNLNTMFVYDTQNNYDYGFEYIDYLVLAFALKHNNLAEKALVLFPCIFHRWWSEMSDRFLPWSPTMSMDLGPSRPPLYE